MTADPELKAAIDRYRAEQPSRLVHITEDRLEEFRSRLLERQTGQAHLAAEEAFDAECIERAHEIADSVLGGLPAIQTVDGSPSFRQPRDTTVSALADQILNH